MNYSTQQIKAVNLSEVVSAAGVELTRRAGRYVGLCPFHTEKTPSFIVFTDNHYKCFGCGEHGDSVDFIRRLHGCNFPEALRYLGIEGKPPSKAELRVIKQKATRTRQRVERERELAFTMGTLIRQINKAAEALTPENFEEFCEILDPLAWYEWGHDVLCYGNRAQRAIVLWSFKGFPAIERNTLFDPKFDFVKWLRNFTKGAPPNEQKTATAAV
ncbi:MAG: hypothetical protein B6I22_14650 [Desulfobacteraceae bacterium 4572_123]|nr:MAG: hypothetical protein B6I22_14650 [Desulfobacteraceae bacterium 4572_123]